MAVSGIMSERSAAENGEAVAMRLKGCGIVLLVLFIALGSVIKVPPLLVPREYTELLDAASRGDIKTIDHLLDAGLDVNAAYFEGIGDYFLSKRGTRNTALIFAAEYGQFGTIEHLLDRGADPWLLNSNFRGVFDKMAYQVSCFHSTHGIKILLGEEDYEPQKFKRCEEARRVLARLVLKCLEFPKNVPRVVACLSESAVLSGDAEVVRKVGLIAPGEIYTESLLDLAAALGYESVVVEILRSISDVAQLSHAAAEAITYGNTEVALIFVERGVSVDCQDRGGWTLLHLAASKGDAALVRQLLQRGAKTDIRNKSDKLAIDYANDGAIRRLLAQPQ